MGRLDAAGQAALKARQGVRYQALEDLAVMDPATMRPVPRRRRDARRSDVPRQHRHEGLSRRTRAATEAALAGGWFHSGDLGVMHPDGYIQLKDRVKDIIISGGENISSIEVEDVLYKHPAVAAVAVVARPDEKWGETPCAFVELKPGEARDRGGDSSRTPATHLARYKVPAPRRLRRDPENLARARSRSSSCARWRSPSELSASCPIAPRVPAAFLRSRTCARQHPSS